MRMKDIFIVLAGVFLSILVVCNLYAQPNGMTYYRFLDKLDLTKKQRDKIADLRIKYEREKLDFHAELKALRLKLCKYMENAEQNLDIIEETYKKIGEIQIKAKMARLKNQIQRKKVLTDEQKVKLKKLIDEQIENKRFKIKTYGMPGIRYFDCDIFEPNQTVKWNDNTDVQMDDWKLQLKKGLEILRLDYTDN